MSYLPQEKVDVHWLRLYVGAWLRGNLWHWGPNKHQNITYITIDLLFLFIFLTKGLK